MGPEDTLTWNQIELIHEYLFLVGQLGMAWFAGSVTVNASVAWALLDKNMPRKGRLVPVIVFINDLIGAAGCFCLIWYYWMQLERLKGMLTSLSVPVDRTPIFPFTLFAGVAVGIGLVNLTIAFAWWWATWRLKVFDEVDSSGEA